MAGRRKRSALAPNVEAITAIVLERLSSIVIRLMNQSDSMRLTW